MKQALKMGAIGCGYWGPNLIRNFVEIPDSKLIAIADLDGERLAHLQSRYPQIQKTFQDYKEFFNLGLDAVVIATPPSTHYQIAADCLENGLHVLIEKPITLKSEDARKLRTLAAEKGLILMVGHTFEYNPAVRMLKEMIESGELGKIYYVDAIRASLGLFQTKANVLWDLAPHDISILRYILGADPESISVQAASCVQTGIADVAYATLQFPDDVLTHIRLSWLDPSKTRRITVVGSEKMVIYDDVESLEKIKIYEKGVKATRHTDTYGEFSFAYHYGDVVIPYIRLEEPLRVQCQHFLDCVREGKRPQTDGENGLQVVRVLEAGQYSMDHEGQKVNINQTDDVTPYTNGSAREKAHV
jgi:predicted dehydrogenase